MNKQLQSTETNRLPVRLRLPQISPQELKMIRIAIRRKDLPHDMVCTGTLIRTLDDPRSLILHKPGNSKSLILSKSGC